MDYEDLVTNNTKLVYLVLKKMNLYSRADSINIEHQIEKQELIKKLYKAISMLNLREQEILYALYGLNNQKCLTQRQLKERYGFNSQSSISAIKRRCISKLKKIMDGECL